MFIHRPTEMKAPENPGPRFYIGLVVFITSFFMLPAGLVLREFIADSFLRGFVLGVFWISAPLMKIGSVAILGKSSYAWINYQIHYFYHKVTKPHQITPLRYNIGLVMFVLPFLPNYLISFMPHLIPISLWCCCLYLSCLPSDQYPAHVDGEYDSTGCCAKST